MSFLFYCTHVYCCVKVLKKYSLGVPPQLLSVKTFNKKRVFKLWNSNVLISKMEFSAKVSIIKLTLFYSKLLVYGCKTPAKCWISKLCRLKTHTKHIFFKILLQLFYTNFWWKFHWWGQKCHFSNFNIALCSNLGKLSCSSQGQSRRKSWLTVLNSPQPRNHSHEKFRACVLFVSICQKLTPWEVGKAVRGMKNSKKIKKKVHYKPKQGA